MTKITFSIKYHYGDAKDGRLDMYDAAISFQGFAKALSITAHALLNDGEITKKGHRIKGGELFINPSRKGSFEQIVTFIATNPEAIGASVAAAAFYDLIKWTWSQTLEIAYQPTTPHVQKLSEKIEPFIGEMEEVLEIPLEQAQRPIKKDNEVVISIKRQRVGEVIKLDLATPAGTVRIIPRLIYVRWGAFSYFSTLVGGMSMLKILYISVILWAWGCWGWVVYSHQWMWLIASIVPYFLYTSFGHYLERPKKA